jgi:hypothetical protein
MTVQQAFSSDVRPNQPAAPNPAVASPLHTGRHWRGVSEPGCASLSESCMPEPEEIIARRELTGVAVSGDRFPVLIEIGRPRPMGDPNNNWRCSVSVTPLLHCSVEIGGYDSLQALTLAISLAHQQLVDFVGRGGRLRYAKSDDEFKLDEAFLKGF